ncbi:hypothetical protein [Motilibacter deserti]|uniref:Uncharacterized protein n=1 Tax=Motilibacter deserti TaxID=2714956 RepID=A0ABX0H275_9ACTN|nr:hypothetical protein [Motilibacter deserti]NHC16149.1 hypothetical protein [Motilibacter deserti]
MLGDGKRPLARQPGVWGTVLAGAALFVFAAAGPAGDEPLGPTLAFAAAFTAAVMLLFVTLDHLARKGARQPPR